MDNTALAAEARYPMNFTEPRKRFALNVHFNRSNSFLFVNTTKIFQFEATEYYTLCLGNIWKKFTTRIVIYGIKFVKNENNQKHNHCGI